MIKEVMSDVLASSCALDENLRMIPYAYL